MTPHLFAVIHAPYSHIRLIIAFALAALAAMTILLANSVSAM